MRAAFTEAGVAITAAALSINLAAMSLRLPDTSAARRRLTEATKELADALYLGGRDGAPKSLAVRWTQAFEQLLLVWKEAT